MKNVLKLIIGLFLFSSLIFFCFLTGLIAKTPLKEAMFYNKLDKGAVQCHLCPRNCFIVDGKRGYCGVRENQSGTLYALSFGKLVSLNDLDPIEKKPLFHFLPGVRTFSIATAGCNLKCKFCQNWEISQKRPEEVDFEYIEPEELIKKVKASGLKVVAFTYNEPVVFYEYMLEVAKLAKTEGLITVMHSNGYVNEEPLRELAKYLDAVNIDLKGFSEEYYVKLSEGSLEPVLKTLKILHNAGVHLEITNLVIPDFNDDPELIKKMCLWIRDNLGADTPLHFSRFWPMYKLSNLFPTPVDALERARSIAKASGLKYVYIGNVGGHEAQNSYCPKCGKIVIERKGYFIMQNNIANGKCKFCGEIILGIWE